MTWFVNCSQRVQAVPTGDGNVVAVRPNERVEVKAETPEVQRLMNLRVLARAGRTARPVTPRKAPVAVVVPSVPTPFAQEIHEKDVAPPAADQIAVKNVDEDAGAVAEVADKWHSGNKRGRRR